MNIISRSKAKELGLTHYFTGKECIRGHVDKRYASGKCVSCAQEDTKSWREDNRERSNELRRGQYWKDPEVARESAKKYRKENPDKVRDYNLEKYWDDPDKMRARRKEYYWNNRDAIRKKDSEYGKANRAERLEAERRYIAKNREKVRARKRAYNNRKYKEDKHHKAIVFMRRQLSGLFAGKKGRTENLLGYTRDDLVSHIESNFEDGMSWDNYGEWHIDHITPISHFLKEGNDMPHVVHALGNLQPLWAFDNLSKGARLLD